MPAKLSEKHAKKKQNKNKKPAEKNPERKKSVFFFNLFVVSVLIICAISILNNYIKIEQRNERLEILESEYNSVRIKNDSIRNKLEIIREKNFDEDYIINFARANGLRKDNEILFYLYPEH